MAIEDGTMMKLVPSMFQLEPAFGPEQRPGKMSEVGVRQGVLEDIALKTLYLSGPFSISELSNKLCLTYEITNELFFRMRNEMYCQVTGMTGNVQNISITSAGR